MAEERQGARGRMVVLDGVDGCGKSTQAGLLAKRLGASGAEVLHVREPGTTRVGEALRALLLDPGATMGAEVEALLFAASRRQLLDEIIGPALERGAHVVCERFHASTFAYQGIAGEVGGAAVLGLLQAWAGEPAPDLELILELDPDRAAGRQGAEPDRIEAKGLAFQQRVAGGYRDYVSRRGQARLIDGSGDIEAVAARVWQEVADAL